MQKSPSIAVIIVNYNGSDCLQRCLCTLKAQSRPPEKIILVDNGSTDGSADRAVKMCPGIEIFRLDSNLGFAKASNLGVQAANGVEWVVLLNNDAFCDPTWLENLVDAIEKYPQFSSFASRIVSHQDPNILDSAGDVYHVCGFAWKRLHGQAETEFGKRPLEVFSASGTAAVYKRSVFLELGGFDEDFFCYFEDVDLGFRLHLAGHRVLFVPTALVHHLGSKTWGEKSDLCLYYGHRNLIWTFFKNMPAPLLAWYLPQHLLFNLLVLAWYTARGQGRAVFRAKIDAILGLPAFLKKRRMVQKTRKASSFGIRRLMARGLTLPYASSRFMFIRPDLCSLHKT
ncbi:MAG TPA: glycosyltransferase family 2 protein [Acidobacteriota bacterium]|nr:glycosyltransferase family 2 protein [Acidobacteriota bacterium]